jgi:hypothetical protein
MTEQSTFICDPAPGRLRIIQINGSATHEMIAEMNERLEKAAREGRHCSLRSSKIKASGPTRNSAPHDAPNWHLGFCGGLKPSFSRKESLS